MIHVLSLSCMEIVIPLDLFIPSLCKDEEAMIFTLIDEANRMPIHRIFGKK
jgi:hypothetical protein